MPQTTRSLSIVGSLVVLLSTVAIVSWVVLTDTARTPSGVDAWDVVGEGAVLIGALLIALRIERLSAPTPVRNTFLLASLALALAEAVDVLDEFFVLDGIVYKMLENGGKIFGALAIAYAMHLLTRAIRDANVEREHYRSRSFTDALTGLKNRAALEDRLKGLSADKLGGDPLAAIYIDADDFKQLNDRFGHECGDAAMRALSNVILQAIRRSDSAFRIGGDEFVVILPGNNASMAKAVAERIQTIFADQELAPCGTDEIGCTLSIGVAALKAGENGTELLSRADRAMYQAKRLGKNRVCVARPSSQLPEVPPSRRARKISSMASE